MRAQPPRRALPRLALALAMSLAPAGPTLAAMPEARALAAAAAASPELAAFYAARGHAPLWIGTGAPAARLEALLGALDGAEAHGLASARWDAAAIRVRLGAIRSMEEAGAAEVALSALFLDYAAALEGGAVEPRAASPALVREISRRAPAELLAAAEGGDVAALLRGLAPRSAEYGRLMRHKAALERAVADGWGPEVAAARLALGDSGPEVLALRERLRAMGAMGRSLSPVYDEALAEAVRGVQARAGLPQDGIAGPRTLAEINASPEARLGQVLVAMERERWLPRERGARHVRVNLAAFTAEIVDGETVSFSIRAVIGSRMAGRETPEFSDEMEYMVINPSWHVPRSIAVEEYLPRLRADPYAARHMEIVDGSGRAVDRGRGFSRYDARSFPYTLRQKPGPTNALGSVKFMFPNVYNIYLHDTPAKGLFDEPVRAYSHGCVRLAEPRAFALTLLARQSVDPAAAFDRVREGGRETRLSLDEPVPVHIDYRTAFTDARGALHFRPDVYDRDAAVLAALRAALAAPVAFGG